MFAQLVHRYAQAPFLLRILNLIWYVCVCLCVLDQGFLAGHSVFSAVAGFIVWRHTSLWKGNGKHRSSLTSPTTKQEIQSQ